MYAGAQKRKNHHTPSVMNLPKNTAQGIPDALSGNFFVLLGGGVAGRNIALHNTFIYTPAPTGIDSVTIGDDAPVEYYNLQGVRVDNPAGGLFIRRQGNKAEKVIL